MNIPKYIIEISNIFDDNINCIYVPCVKNKHKWLLLMEKTPDSITDELTRKDIVDYMHAKFRGSMLKILLVININDIIISQDNNLSIDIPNITNNMTNHASNLYYYYKSLEAAYSMFHPTNNYTGKWITWHENGQKYKEYNFVNGLISGTLTEWYNYKEIQKLSECNYIDGIKNGIIKLWHSDGTMDFKSMHKYNNVSDFIYYINNNTDNNHNNQNNH